MKRLQTLLNRALDPASADAEVLKAMRTVGAMVRADGRSLEEIIAGPDLTSGLEASLRLTEGRLRTVEAELAAERRKRDPGHGREIARLKAEVDRLKRGPRRPVVTDLDRALYCALQAHGPQTAGELRHRVGAALWPSSSEVGHNRLSGLQARGVVLRDRSRYPAVYSLEDDLTDDAQAVVSVLLS